MKSFSRRSFLETGIIAGGAAAFGLAACSPSGANRSNPSANAENSGEQTSDEDLVPSSTESCDIVVAGSGTAGLVAAVRAAQLGASVVLLEKNPTVGGTSIMTEGVFGVGSRIQKEKGIETTADEIFSKAMDYHHWAASGRVLRKFVDESGSTIDWLLDMGIKFTGVRAIGASAQVWHCYDGTANDNLIKPLQAIAENEGVSIRLSTPAVKLLTDSDGAICGVLAKDSKGDVIQFDCPCVILATGGYASNPDLFEEFTDVKLDQFVSWGVDGRDGDGITMGRNLGARLHLPGAVMYSGATVEGCTKFYDIPNMVIARQPNLRVNQEAKRFFNEGTLSDFTAYYNSLTAQAQAFSIIDQSYVDMLENDGIFFQVPSAGYFAGKPLPGAHDGLVENENVVQANTIGELAEKLGLDRDALEATVAEYNALCEAGVDTQFGKDAKYLQPLTTAPYYGAKMIRTFFTTVGGLDVDDNIQVLNQDGRPIKGLYACGGDASSIYGANYDVNVASGSQQGWCANSGRLAAEHAVENFVK